MSKVIALQESYLFTQVRGMIMNKVSEAIQSKVEYTSVQRTEILGRPDRDTLLA